MVLDWARHDVTGALVVARFLPAAIAAAACRLWPFPSSGQDEFAGAALRRASADASVAATESAKALAAARAVADLRAQAERLRLSELMDSSMRQSPLADQQIRASARLVKKAQALEASAAAPLPGRRCRGVEPCRPGGFG